MKSNALNQLSKICDQDQQAHWPEHPDDHDRPALGERQIPYTESPPSQKPDDCGFTRQSPYVEGIEVYADKSYMYCKGKLGGLVSHAPADVVVAVEWFDHNQKVLKTDWKRVSVHPGSKSVLATSEGTQPFIIKTPLDRRVISVKVYAFFSPQ